MNAEPGTGRVLVDTSAWIAFFRLEDQKTALAVRQAVADGTAVVPKIVLAELMQGAKSDKELAVISDLARSIPTARESEATWSAAGELAYRLKRKGLTIPLADCYIAVLARENGSRVLTLDSHFKNIDLDNTV
jgi:predicted nucleic acid-binding protein